jgi:hypothetical protein
MTGLSNGAIDMFAQLQLYINSRIPIVWLLTGEEFRAERGIAKYARTFEWAGTRSLLGIWSLTGGPAQAGGWSEFDGWTSDPFNGSPLPDDFYPQDPVGAKMAATPHGGLLRGINWATEHPTHPCILIVRDAHNFLSNDYWRRVLKDAEVKLRKTLTTIVCISVSDELPQDLRRHVAYIRPGLPSLEALIGQLSPTIKKLEIKTEPRDCAAALRGLTSQQALDLLTIDFSKHGNVDTSRLSKLKATELASVHGVSFRGDPSDFGVVGGFDVFKKYMSKRRWAFGQEARDFGIDQPKGVVFIGVPGGGKTLMGAAAAGELGLPLIILNLSECEGGIVGETATRTAEALRTVDALSPCVVLVDEAEKIFWRPGQPGRRLTVWHDAPLPDLAARAHERDVHHDHQQRHLWYAARVDQARASRRNLLVRPSGQARPTGDPANSPGAAQALAAERGHVASRGWSGRLHRQ